MAKLSKEVRDELRKMIEAGSFHTDSDLYDYAEERGLPMRDVDRTVWEIISENTPCHGCKNVTFMSTGMYPCSCCSRRAKDMYEPAE